MANGGYVAFCFWRYQINSVAARPEGTFTDDQWTYSADNLILRMAVTDVEASRRIATYSCLDRQPRLKRARATAP